MFQNLQYFKKGRCNKYHLLHDESDLIMICRASTEVQTKICFKFLYVRCHSNHDYFIKLIIEIFQKKNRRFANYFEARMRMILETQWNYHLMLASVEY